jgi:hypothetical protein
MWRRVIWYIVVFQKTIIRSTLKIEAKYSSETLLSTRQTCQKTNLGITRGLPFTVVFRLHEFCWALFVACFHACYMSLPSCAFRCCQGQGPALEWPLYSGIRIRFSGVTFSLTYLSRELVTDMGLGLSFLCSRKVFPMFCTNYYEFVLVLRNVILAMTHEPLHVECVIKTWGIHLSVHCISLSLLLKF